jgi:hypothetical protein
MRVLMKHVRVPMKLKLWRYWLQGPQFIVPSSLLVLLNSFLSSRDLVSASPRRRMDVAFFIRKI